MFENTLKKKDSRYQNQQYSKLSQKISNHPIPIFLRYILRMLQLSIVISRTTEN
jgi:hypothetical protein